MAYTNFEVALATYRIAIAELESASSIVTECILRGAQPTLFQETREATAVMNIGIARRRLMRMPLHQPVSPSVSPTRAESGISIFSNV
jgi:hypothetical protein